MPSQTVSCSNASMKVRWKLPDGTERQQQVPDLEQLMFVLRLVGGVTIDGADYRIAGSSLVVEDDKLAIAVKLA